MDSLQWIFHSMQEKGFQHFISIHNSILSVVFVLICLLTCYYVYSVVVVNFLEKTKIPKLYKITTLHSLWMGFIHLISSALCFTQMSPVLQPSILLDLPQPFFLKEMMNVATANFCQNTTVSVGNISLEDSSDFFEETSKWTLLNSVSIYIISAILIQEILLATRNKMDEVFYSRFLGLIFLTSAVRTRCPMLGIQGTYLISINSSSKEFARALVAWKSYSQEDSDHRPPPLLKVVAFLFFVVHMVIWFALMLFCLPFFIHKLPSIAKDDANRFFLAYSYLSILAYTVLEAATSPLWTTIRCLSWCRRSSGMRWRILALSDCHLLGHYSPIVLELYRIQMILDEKKALFRNRMVQKHLALVERRKRKEDSDSPARRPPNLLAAVKTVVALRRKIKRKEEDMAGCLGSVEEQHQEVVSPENLDVKPEVTSENEEIIGVIESMQDPDYRKSFRRFDKTLNRTRRRDLCRKVHLEATVSTEDTAM